jgi:hypothetical protein
MLAKEGAGELPDAGLDTDQGEVEDILFAGLGGRVGWGGGAG